MLTISVEFLHGTYRADPDGSAIGGRAERGEWPPSVARLLAAFVAADGTGEWCRLTDGSELEFLEALGAPVIHADADPFHQSLCERFVVKASRRTADMKHTHQEYPARKGDEVRPGVRVTPRSPKVAYVWDDAEPRDFLHALRLRAARIGYLGCADSPVRLRVDAESSGADLSGLHAFRPDTSGTCMISVPRPGHHLTALDAAFEAWLEQGPAVGRSQFPALRNLVAYAGPEDVVGDDEPGRVIAWLRLHQSIPGRRIAEVTAVLRAAVMERYQRLYGDPPPRELHGHGYEGTGYEIARYLALPNVGFGRSDGRIHGLAVWLPRTSDAETVERTRGAARSIDVLTASNLTVQVAPWQGETKPLAATPRRWRAASRVWVTAVPAVHERYGRLNLAEIRRWCVHAGLPEPVSARSARVPLIKGALDLHPTQVHPGRSDDTASRKPYSHVELRFREAVRGPVVVGGGRSKGFGLCVPAPERPDQATATREGRQS
ncbi:MAG: type I-U CRISPR-associated protein Csb2 [Acidimicrobiaceae bacterium]|nr:type I-U CRISPR-associated protein Csb2 [Acidimicrobiaceae bacterium]